MGKKSMREDENGTIRSKRELTDRLFVYIKPYMKETIIVILLLLVVMLCSTVNPYLLKIAIDNYIVVGDLKGVFIIGGILLVLAGIALVLSRIRMRMLIKITNNILLNIRNELYQHIQTLSFDFFDNRPVGKILARVMGDVNSLNDLFTQSIQSLIPDLMTLICVSIFMLTLNYKLALVCIIFLPVLLGAIGYIEIFSRKRWAVYRKKRSNMNGFTHENFSGIKVVQSFANEKETANKFMLLLDEFADSFVNAVKLNDLFWPFVDLSWGLGGIIVFFSGYKLVQSSQIEIGTLLAFTSYVGMFWRPISNLSQFYNALITNLSAADRIFDILDIDPLVTDTNQPIHVETIEGKITFNHVSFNYDNKNDVIRDISFEVQKGERVALVGATGSGKTTIISLISRFYDCTEGEILIDNIPITKLSLYDLRSRMGVMLQDTFLFSGTIMENIRYGKLDASDDEVIAAAKIVQADEFISKMEKGYQTEVNERGSRLSLGQRQLISLARALLANPSILILDEATSNIDTKTEMLVQSGIEKLMKNRTCFVIAHRLSTIRDCDKIMVINEGEIDSCGTHEELLKQRGKYYDLYKSQYKFLNEGA